ncbi:MAG: hypothetical protein E7643_00485 [Ruminococcaceae bacterium]|nr:hypothetical protein [Oscillospiraceae bacterium]
MPNSRTPRIIGRIIKLTAVLLVFSVCGVLIWRMVTSRDPDSIGVLIPNDALCEVYEREGDALLMRYQNQTTITRAEHNSGYFSVTQYVFIPQANQIQLVFRYNNSTLGHLAADYGLPETPDKAGTYFDVTVTTAVDLTPDVREDNYTDDGTTPDCLEIKRYYPTAELTRRETTSLYTYYRYVFEDVPMEAHTVGVFADIYYLEDLDYREQSYGTLCLFDDEAKWIEQKLSAADVEALDGYVGGLTDG